MTEPSADRRPIVGLPGERQPVPGIPNPIVVRARADETGGAFEVYEVGLSGEGTDLVAGPPPTTHREHEEIFYVLEGQVEFSFAEDRAAAPAGTLIVVPRGTRHHFRGTAGSRLLVLSIPAGLAGIFEELGAGRDAGRAEADIRAAIGAKYDSWPDGS
jgi:mannose-6-phosphate isomerase-like protein (cupin superfamily)